MVRIINKKSAWIYIFSMSFLSWLVFWLLAIMLEPVRICIPWLPCIHPFWHIFRFMAFFMPLIVLLSAIIGHDDEMPDYVDYITKKSYIMSEERANIYLIDFKKGEQNEDGKVSFITRH